MILEKTEQAFASWLTHFLPGGHIKILPARSGGPAIDAPFAIVHATNLRSAEAWPSDAGVFDLTCTISIKWPASGANNHDRPSALDSALHEINCAVLDTTRLTSLNVDTADWSPYHVYDLLIADQQSATEDSYWLETISLAITAGEHTTA